MKNKMLSWAKKNEDECYAMGEHHDNMMFEILYNGQYTLITKISPNTVHELMNEIGWFKTLEKAKMVAQLIDEG